MITLYPLKYNDYYNYYKSLNFTLSETSLLLNINGTFVNQNISKIIQLNKNAFITSQTVINNSLTALYTYLLVDLNSYTYASNNITFNSTEPHKPEFLLYFNSNYVCINDYVASVTSSSPSTGTGSTAGGSGSDSSSGSESGSGSGTSASGTTTSSSTSTTTTVLAPTRYTDTGVPIYDNNPPLKLIEIIENNSYVIEYTRLFVDSNFPTNPQQHDTFYDIKTNRYYIYIDNAWYQIDWRKLNIYNNYTKYIAYYRFYQNNYTDISETKFYYNHLISNSKIQVIPLISLTALITNESYIYHLYYTYINGREYSTKYIQNNATLVTFPYFAESTRYILTSLPSRPINSISYLTLFGFLQNNLLYTDQSITISIYEQFDSYSRSTTIVTNIPFYALHRYNDNFPTYSITIGITGKSAGTLLKIPYYSITNTILPDAYSGSYAIMILPVPDGISGSITVNSATIISTTLSSIIVGYYPR